MPQDLAGVDWSFCLMPNQHPPPPQKKNRPHFLLPKYHFSKIWQTLHSRQSRLTRSVIYHYKITSQPKRDHRAYIVFGSENQTLAQIPRKDNSFHVLNSCVSRDFPMSFFCPVTNFPTNIMYAHMSNHVICLSSYSVLSSVTHAASVGNSMLQP
jgi:hypothetical protein